MNDLQKWVNGCFQSDSTEVSHDYPHELTPPTTPIESKVTTFTSQKLFEAFDAAKQGKNKDNTPPPSIKDDLSPVVIFSSKQPVLSTREITTMSTSVIESPKSLPGIITPQPSPKNETEFFITKSTIQNTETTTTTTTINSEKSTNATGETKSTSGKQSDPVR